jgi:hypothetical protein
MILYQYHPKPKPKQIYHFPKLEGTDCKFKIITNPIITNHNKYLSKSNIHIIRVVLYSVKTQKATPRKQKENIPVLIL